MYIDTACIMPGLTAEETGPLIESLRAAGESVGELQKAVASYF